MDSSRDIKDDLKLLNDRMWELETKIIEQENILNDIAKKYNSACIVLESYLLQMDSVKKGYKLLMDSRST